MVNPTPPDAENVRRAAEQIERNIAAIVRMEQASLENRPLGDRVAGAIGGFVGSIKFAVLHVALVTGWLLLNRSDSTWTFDPYPHSWLMLLLGSEAILLSTFVLINQHQMQKIADRRAHLNLQIDLLAESEMTKIVSTFQAIAEHLGVPGVEEDEELRDLAVATEVEQVAQVIEAQLSGPTDPIDPNT
jgi:uncharacterized membrane protein